MSMLYYPPSGGWRNDARLMSHAAMTSVVPSPMRAQPSIWWPEQDVGAFFEYQHDEYGITSSSTSPHPPALPPPIIMGPAPGPDFEGDIPSNMPIQSVIDDLAHAAMSNPAEMKKRPRRRRPRKRTRQALALTGGFWPRSQSRDTIWPQKLLINVSHQQFLNGCRSVSSDYTA